MYEKEVIDEQTKLERMKNQKKDEYDIRKQVQLPVLSEQLLLSVIPARSVGRIEEHGPRL